MSQTSDKTIQINVLKTPVKIRPLVLANVAGLWAGLALFTGRQRPWPARLVVSGLATAVMMAADFGHALAHTVSARLAGAPMDEIRISADMPRTIYFDNDVTPKTHRLRALGGPIFSALNLLAGLLLRALAPRDSAAHELAGWSALGHGLILGGSLAPLPIVDGGAILKWTLVEQGQSEAEADRIVRFAGLATGAAAVGAGVVVASTALQPFALSPARRRLIALGLVAAGLVAIGAALGKIE